MVKCASTFSKAYKYCISAHYLCLIITNYYNYKISLCELRNNFLDISFAYVIILSVAPSKNWQG